MTTEPYKAYSVTDLATGISTRYYGHSKDRLTHTHCQRDPLGGVLPILPAGLSWSPHPDFFDVDEIDGLVYPPLR